MRKIVIIAASIVLLAIVAGGGVYYFVMRSAPSKTATAPKPQPEFVALDPMVVNLQGSDGSAGNGNYSAPSYLQVGFKLATTNDKAVQAFKDMQPAIRGNVLDLLLQQPASVTTSDAARKKMKAAVLNTVNQTIADQIDNANKAQGFSKVYITRFVTQAE